MSESKFKTDMKNVLSVFDLLELIGRGADFRYFKLMSPNPARQTAIPTTLFQVMASL